MSAFARRPGVEASQPRYRFLFDGKFRPNGRRKKWLTLCVASPPCSSDNAFDLSSMTAFADTSPGSSVTGSIEQPSELRAVASRYRKCRFKARLAEIVELCSNPCLRLCPSFAFGSIDIEYNSAAGHYVLCRWSFILRCGSANLVEDVAEVQVTPFFEPGPDLSKVGRNTEGFSLWGGAVCAPRHKHGLARQEPLKKIQSDRDMRM